VRLTIPIGLRWSDLDAYGHVNNVAMLRILEEARIQAFWATDAADAGEPARSTAVLDAQPGASVLTLIARQEMEYLAPVPYHRAPLDIELWMGRIGGASLQICYEIHSPQGAEPRVLYGRAATTLVMVDAASGTPRRIGEREREAWTPYLEQPIEFSRR